MTNNEPQDQATGSERSKEALDWREISVSIAATVLVAAALGLALATAADFEELKGLVQSNAVSLAARRRWVLTAGGLAGTALVLQLLLLPWRARWVPVIARVASPLLLTPFIPPLLVRGPWDNDLHLLALLGVLGLSLEGLLMISVGALTRSPCGVPLSLRYRRVIRWVPWLIVLAGAVYYAVLISKYTIICHEKLYTSKADLAEFDNLFFNALHGHPFRAPALESNILDWSALKIHAEFILYIFLPIYALSPRAETLLVLQTCVIALTAIPVFLLAARRLGPWSGAIVAGAYLLWPAVQRPNFYDFHFVPFAAMFVSWTLYFLDRYSAVQARALRRRRLVPLVIAFVLSMLSREDVAMGLVVLGFAYAIVGPRPLTGAALGLLALVYVSILRSLVHAWFGPHWFPTMYAQLQAPESKGFAAIVWTLLTNPAFVFKTLLIGDKLTYCLHLTVPLLFLWVRRPLLLAAALPGFFFTLMVTDRPPLYESSFQYTYLWVPYLMGASTLALDHLQKMGGKARVRAALGALLVTSLLASYHQGVLLGRKQIVGGFGLKTFEVSDADRHRLSQLRRLASQIPPDASVGVTERNAPHFSSRVDLFPSLDLQHKPEYLVIGYHMGQYERDLARYALNSKEYGVVDVAEPFALLKRGADPAQNQRADAVLR